VAKEWSAHQLAIFNEVISGTGNLIVIARAGSGKTSTLVEAIKRIPNKQAKVLAVAFNKKIAKELDERIDKSYITISTLHSLGLSRIRSHFKNVKVVPDKLRYLILSLFEGKISAGDSFLLEKAVNLCKSSITDTPSKIDELMDAYDIDPIELSREEFIRSIIKLLRLSKDHKDQVDYADMIWFNVVFDIPGQLYDIIFIDEIQDLTRSQIHLALSTAKKGAKIVALGDNNQCIYSWNGVDIDVIDRLKEKIGAKTLGLPISYRCPKKVVDLAKEYAADIESAPFAKEGNIANISEDKLIDYVKPGDFVISRTNAPLIKHCMFFLKNGVKSNIAGKDVGAGLLFLLRKSKKKTLPAFVRWLEAWQAGEIKRLKEKNRSSGAILDKCECLLTICDGASSINEVEDIIKNLFEDVDDKDKVVFSSTHGAKGLERDNVFLLKYTFKPGRNQEEKNIMYTAITRAKSNLYWVDKA
jgi:superfamily I DNA/RNA helicase